MLTMGGAMDDQAMFSSPSLSAKAAVKRESKFVIKTLPESAKPSTGLIGKEIAKRSKPDAPKFLLLLYEILHAESDKVIRWSDDGLALQILDQNTVTEKILPKYFNHTNFHSFQRQLNYFGFRKWTKSKTDICTFSHPYFRRNQPELLQLIKRKKAARRTPVPEKPEEYSSQSDGRNSSVSSKRLLPLSPSGKRKLPVDANDNPTTIAQALPTLNTSNVHIHPAANGLSPNGPIPNGFGGDIASHQYHPSAVLTNAISPVAAQGCKKKAKKNEKNAYVTAGDDTDDPVGSATLTVNDLANAPNMERLSPVHGYNKGTLPNLDIVRNRLIRRQQISGTSVAMDGYAHTMDTSPHGAAPMILSGLERINASLPAAPVAVGESSPLFSNSFSDPVDILLRIKKSRALSTDSTHMQSPQQPPNDQADNMASLQNFLLSQSLYTNRLESQLKLALEENDALRVMVDAKQREVDALHNERKLLQNEKSVLLEDKNKLYEINRDLLNKLFPQ
ncbi:hypothetical protein Poli38472_002458 [Pythium oligandrum]|uniref:HSF-type DNA-binding domain-containing protein n=1 Tax=Pythium oligandrum TaxID=41045 RepID=A0A8K1CHJ4_PYTOL|nr:hypothetical protein Poli38472_002458 [Pythium oligandrum]|eukprot:TMW63517.1 hypothetical protein Poli38472_002458 [Pythium oligandrum]